ncbi:MAG TPA: hypothetical protein PKA38_00425 [Candidatus Levybacteria bacterium]|nr:hypothetical protein [Candidatus Levybacteria bacterium]
MRKMLILDAFGWGIGLWLLGYALGIALFAVVPTSLLGWVISPIGVLATLFVLIKKIKSHNLSYYLLLSISWTLIAILFDYFFLLQLFHPKDGYYKLDVYLYYLLTFTLPIIVGFMKTKKTT